jgi:hypothetical protein
MWFAISGVRQAGVGLASVLQADWCVQANTKCPSGLYSEHRVAMLLENAAQKSKAAAPLAGTGDSGGQGSSSKQNESSSSSGVGEGQDQDPIEVHVQYLRWGELDEPSPQTVGKKGNKKKPKATAEEEQAIKVAWDWELEKFLELHLSPSIPFESLTKMDLPRPRWHRGEIWVTAAMMVGFWHTANLEREMLVGKWTRTNK